MVNGTRGRVRPDTGLRSSTEGVRTLLGDPKRAVIRMSLPLIIAMGVQTLYNLADAVWVSGLGSDALSGVGFFFPMSFMIMALAAGIGIGGGAAISRRIGGRDEAGADNVALHMLLLMVMVSLVITVPAFFLSSRLFEMMGAGDALHEAVSYGRVMFLGTFLVFFPVIGQSVLRAEGDTKRAMVAMIAGSLLNVVLDPVLIYLPPFKMGVAGAAWASLVSMLLTSLLLFYWLFLRKDTFIRLHPSRFIPSLKVVRDIMGVGLPASLQQMSISLNMMIMVLLVVKVGGTDGIAVFSSGWRVTSFAIIPVMGIAAALTSIAAAAYGAKAYHKLRRSLEVGIKMALVIEMAFSLIAFFFAEPLSLLFTWSEGSAHLADDLVVFFRITSLMHFSAAFGMLSSAVFQAIGKGFNSLVVTLLRTVLLTAGFSYLLSVTLGLGLPGIWFGIMLGNLTGAAIGYGWLMAYLRGLGRKGLRTAESTS